MDRANVARNKDWFDLTIFFKVENGRMIRLTKEQVENSYGIRYMEEIMKK